MRISVVMPCRNAAATITRALDSIAAQAWPDLEVIVRDGASTDGTQDIVCARNDLALTLASEPDGGVADALNRGFAAASGDIFCYLNADDTFAPSALARVAEFFATHPEIDVLTGGCRRVFADGSEAVTAPPPEFLDLVAYRNYFEQPSTFWRATAHRRAGAFDEGYALAFDWEWWNRLRASGARFAAIPDVLSSYYFSDDNLTSRGGLRVVDEMYRVTKRYAPRHGAIADVYRFLFRTFDLRGFYDRPFAALAPVRQVIFGAALAALYALYGRTPVGAYNWNWASKQIRGLPWYK